MNNLKSEFLDNLPNSIEEEVSKGHAAYEAEHGVVCDYKTFSIIIKNESNNVLGVLSAYTAFSEIYIDDIWVAPNHRRSGVGRKLLGLLEECFKGKGYNNINLVTSQFQAPEFYKKCGFEIEFIRINKFNPKLTKTFFIKYFHEKIQDKGTK